MNNDRLALFGTYLEETDEFLREIEELLLSLEKHPGNEEYFNRLFRAIHTLKGSSLFMGFKKISNLAHEVEDVLSSVRGGRVELRGNTIDVLFKSLGLLKRAVDDVINQREDDIEYSHEIIEELRGISKVGQESPSYSAEHESATSPPVEGRVYKKSSREGDVEDKFLAGILGSDWAYLLSNEEKDLLLNLRGGEHVYYMRIEFPRESTMSVARAMLAAGTIEVNTKLVKSFPSIEYLEEDFRGSVGFLFVTELGEERVRDLLEDEEAVIVVLRDLSNEQLEGEAGMGENMEVPRGSSGKGTGVDIGGSREKDPTEMDASDTRSVESNEGATASNKGVPAKDKIMKETIRVDVHKLDELMNLVGELVINRTRNYALIEKLRYARGNESIVELFLESLHEEGRIVYELQESIMKSRMVPIRIVFDMFPLVVRDMAKKAGKKVDCIISGESTELDKKLVDGLKEPLMHLVRNAIDHGIETPNERKKIGKGEAGHLIVDAYQEYNQIIVSISDDGRGIDRKCVIRKAVESGLLNPGEEKGLSDSQIVELIFQPGFSTADEITLSSGRGVGMDVVKRDIERLNGSVEIISELHQGTTVLIRLPLTLAIIQGLLVENEGRVFALPISDVSEIIKVNSSDIRRGHDGGMLIQFRDEVLGLYTLSELLEFSGVSDIDDICYVIVVSTRGEKIGIIVDKLLGEQEIVIKSLKGVFLNVEGIAGAAIMGDGAVIPILDIPVLFRKKYMSVNVVGLNSLQASARAHRV